MASAQHYPLVFTLLLVLTGAVPEPSCDGEGLCDLPSEPQRLSLLGENLIVGAIDYLFAFSPDLAYLDGTDVSPSAARKQHCTDVDAHQPALCRNFVRVVQPVPDDQSGGSKVLVCGTNAFFPKCRFHQLGNLSSWSYMTPEDQKDVGFSPHSNNTNVAVLASNGRFFTATFFIFRQIQQTIGMSPLPPDGNGAFTVQTPSSDLRWINAPDFVSAYEVGEHVYFFAKEPAYELAGERSVEYSRAIRICKNDPGFQLFPGDETLTFLTFQKARLRCTYRGSDGSIPYDYDRLQATFLLQSSDGGEPTLYGAFSTPANGPAGAAVCKFSFASLQSVFEDGQYRVQGDSGWELSSPGSFSCPNGTVGEQRSQQHAETYQLVYNTASALEPQPLHQVSGDLFTHVAVDVASYDGGTLEVILLSQESGAIMQVVQYGGSIYRNTVRTVNSGISNILVHKGAHSEVRQVIFTTRNSVQSFTLGKCSVHSTCFECFDSRDPYCAWNQATGHCVNKLDTTTSASLPDSLTASEDTVVGLCGPRPDIPLAEPNPSTCPHTPTDAPIDTPEPNETEIPTPSDSSVPGPEETGTPSVGDPGGLGGAGGGEENAGLLAGATVGGFLFGIPVGLVVCYFFFSLFLNKGSKPAEPVEATADTLQVNRNQLDGHSEKQPNRSRHLEQDLHRSHPTKNVNQVEDDDALMDLPARTGNSGIPQSKAGLPPLQAPPSRRTAHLQPPPPGKAARQAVSRGRTESTRCLRASESSDWESSLSPLSSPV